MGLMDVGLMIQSVLAQKHWQKRLTERDLQAITPLIFSHVNPYGLFKLDMKERISRLSQPLVAYLSSVKVGKMKQEKSLKLRHQVWLSLARLDQQFNV